MRLRFVANDTPSEFDFLNQYEHVYESEDKNLKIVTKHDRWGVVDTTGNEVIPVIYKEIEDFEGDYIIARLETSYGLIDKNNNIFLPFEYQTIISTNEIFVASKVAEQQLQSITLFSKEFNLNFETNIKNFKPEKISYFNLLGNQILKVLGKDNNQEIYFIKKENIFEFLKCPINNSIFYNSEEYLIDNTPLPGQFIIKSVFHDFIRVDFRPEWREDHFKGRSDGTLSALCKIKNNELIPFIPFNSLQLTVDMSSAQRSQLENKVNFDSILSHYLKPTPITVNISNKTFIRAAFNKNFGLFNMDGTEFIPQKYKVIYELLNDKLTLLGFTHLNSHRGADYDEPTYIDINTGLEKDKKDEKDEEDEKIKNLIPSKVIPTLFFETKQGKIDNSRITDFYLTKGNGQRLQNFPFNSIRYFIKDGESQILLIAQANNFIYILNRMGRVLKKFEGENLVYSHGMSQSYRYSSFKINWEASPNTNRMTDGLAVGTAFEGERPEIFNFNNNTKKDSLFFVATKNKVGALDLNFNVQIPFEYDELEYLPMMNSHQDYMIARKFDSTYTGSITDTQNQTVKFKGSYGVISINNEPVLPFIFDQVSFKGVGQTLKLFSGRIGASEFDFSRAKIEAQGKKMYETILASPQLYFKNLLDREPKFEVNTTNGGLLDELNPTINESLAESKFQDWLKDIKKGQEHYKNKDAAEKIIRKLKREELKTQPLLTPPSEPITPEISSEIEVPDEIPTEIETPTETVTETPIPTEEVSEPTEQSFDVRLNEPLRGNDGTQYEPGTVKAVPGTGRTVEERRRNVLDQLHNMYPQTTDDWFTVL